jgi:transglutaminase-like putative cysteine protease
MRLTIRHETRYRYLRPVRFGRHRLVLRPREGHDLAVTRHALSIEPAHLLTWVRDVHGNVIALVDFSEPGTQLSIVNEVTVTRTAAFPDGAFHSPFRVPWPPAYDALEATPVAAYAASIYQDERQGLAGWLAECFAPAEDDAEGALLALCRTVHGRIAYRRRHEKGVQSPLETLRIASGSCRDMATLLMEAARASGLAARFASGYLHADASIAGRASTHAWTEIYLPLLGWRGFDPTLGEAVDLRHVVTGVSHHPRGVMPVSGKFDGVAADFAELTVAVRTTEESSAAT